MNLPCSSGNHVKTTSRFSGAIQTDIGYLPTEEEYPYGGYEVTINPIVYGPVTGLWMSPVDSTATEITKTILELYRT